MRKRQILFTLFFVFTLTVMLTIPVYAANVTLAWDASPSTDVTGYRIYNRDYTHGYISSSPLWEGPELTCTVTVPDGREVAFVATAYRTNCYTDIDGNSTECESGYSNEVLYKPTVSPPEPPRNVIVQILIAVLDFFGHFFV